MSNLNFLAVCTVLAPLYCNTVLASLNVREYVRCQGRTETTVSVISRIQALRLWGKAADPEAGNDLRVALERSKHTVES